MVKYQVLMSNNEPADIGDAGDQVQALENEMNENGPSVFSNFQSGSAEFVEGLYAKIERFVEVAAFAMR